MPGVIGSDCWAGEREKEPGCSAGGLWCRVWWVMPGGEMGEGAPPPPLQLAIMVYALDLTG